ncbi:MULTISPECIES: hypothetical protein [unclassified Streptomyces]|uniref:hypothetical protein n=1 Tax=unclassified Streptomyces TaxID=2593676 RepID=UPI0022B66346|nr:MULTISPECIES: hypothetical protein [unclassified Streptomyces]MCZ7417245.1 hypothetical protein [Streptomyces sp. WMMC897]MCZ7432928.1 hypothetical protein [Streptomyces sp. WMMC1477]
MSFADWYQREILDTGKQPLLCAFLGLLVAFLFIRVSVRLIRADVRWWPKNVETGGMHIHHVVFGVVFMIVAGLGLSAPVGDDRPWAEILATLFGVGTALVLDEFALILHLQDVYWQEQGRLSVDAVVLGVAACGLLLVGLTPFGLGEEGGSGWSGVLVILANGSLAVVTLVKGKVFTGLVGIMVPLFALVGAVRLAHPASPWARRFYRPGSHRAHRAQVRERRGGWRRTLRIRVYNAIAGRPTQPAATSASPAASAEQPTGPAPD